jgi:glycosyltransferase involved in cell wall biosynthesis
MGGAEAQLTSVLEADPAEVDRFGVHMICLTPNRDPNIVGRLEALGIPITTIDRTSMRALPFLYALIRFLWRTKPDLVHTFLSSSSGTWGRLAARLVGVRRVMHSDLSLMPTVTPLQRTLEPLVNLLTDRFLPNAAAIAQRLERQGVPTRKIRIVRNGVNLERFDPRRTTSLRAQWGIPEGAVVAGFLGMLRQVKRPELVLEAVQAMPPDARPDFVVVAGDGELMGDMRRRVDADPWLRARCRLLGVVADVPGFLAGIDYLVLPSDTEGLPNAIIEAMAIGRPCVATRVSDVPYLLGDDTYLVEPGDVRGLADAMSRMTSLSVAERTALGRVLRARVLDEFGMDEAAAAFWREHDDLLAGKG